MLRKLTTNELLAIGDGERRVYVPARLKQVCERKHCNGKTEKCFFYTFGVGEIGYYTPVADVEAYVEVEDGPGQGR